MTLAYNAARCMGVKAGKTRNASLYVERFAGCRHVETTMVTVDLHSNRFRNLRLAVLASARTNDSRKDIKSRRGVLSLPSVLILLRFAYGVLLLTS